MRRILALVLALVFVPAQAQLALVGAGKALAAAGGGSPTPPTFQLANGIGQLSPGTTTTTSSWNPGAVGNYLVALTHATEFFGAGTSITAMDHGGTGMTALIAEVESTQGQGRVFGLASPANSSVATTGTISTGIQNEGVIALAYSGVVSTCGTVSGTIDGSDPLGAISIAVPTANAEDIAVGFVWGFTTSNGAIAFTPGTGVTQRRKDDVDAFGFIVATGAGFEKSRTGSTTTITVTPTTGNWPDYRMGYIGICLRGTT